MGCLANRNYDITQVVFCFTQPPSSCQPTLPSSSGHTSTTMADEGSESDVKQRLASLTSSRDSAEALAALGGQDGVARLLGTSLRQGIAEAEVPSRKARFGENRLPTVPPTSLWQHFVDSLDDRDLKILIVAAVASVCFGMCVVRACVLCVVPRVVVWRFAHVTS